MERRNGWAKVVALLCVGVTVGTLVSAPPVRAHISANISHLWNVHLRPKADARYYKKAEANARFLPGSVLPAGVTLRGTFKVGGTNPPGGGTTHAVGVISFGHTLSAAPTVEFVPLATGSTANCPGTFNAPTAAPGYLCLYEEFYGNNNWLQWNPATAKPFGLNLWIHSLTGAGDFWCEGSWAATSM